MRDEFYHPDGPRGTRSHAPIDIEVEQGIRARLRQAFPEWGFVGEETGAEGSSDVFWLVDPNDGTEPFLRGLRGSTVSIALIDDGVPVLGLVYAPTAPDDAGDLFSWAEGCGPLRRNGLPVEPGGPASELTRYSVVLVSHDADAAVEQNLRCCAPARYRSMPSIAYRLALVAAGEADAAVSLNGPAAWDVAAGHALLRGVGGELIDVDGSPPRYAAATGTRLHSCYGGSASVARDLAGRNWRSVFERSAEEAGVFPYPIRPERGKPRLPEGLLARAQGVLLGQLAGDALGSQVEFMDGLAIAERYPQRVTDLVDGGPFELLAGQPTDDSEMALVLARAMILCGGHYSKEMFKAYRQWYYSNPFDCGSTIRKALTSGKYPELSRPSTESQANGALMRACPIGLGAWNDADRAVRWALDDASLTHPHPFCVEASQAFIAAIVAGLNGATPQQMLAVALDASGIRTREVLEAAAGWPPANYQENMGWARIALHNAFYRLLHCDSLEQVIVESVQCGGDTDTNAAIAGALAGAHFGRDGVPQRWTKLILSCRPHAAFRGSRQQRPRYLWPTDALDIAERLLGLY